MYCKQCANIKTREKRVLLSREAEFAEMLREKKSRSLQCLRKTTGGIQVLTFGYYGTGKKVFYKCGGSAKFVYSIPESGTAAA